MMMNTPAASPALPDSTRAIERGGADAAGDERIHLGQRVLEAGRSDQRTEAGGREGGDGQQQPEQLRACFRP